MEADCSEQQGRADIEIRTEDTYTINRKKEIYRKLDDTHQAVESDDYVASSSDSKSIPRSQFIILKPFIFFICKIDANARKYSSTYD